MTMNSANSRPISRSRKFDIINKFVERFRIAQLYFEIEDPNKRMKVVFQLR